MFKKKNCKKCERKISKDYDYCPFCGNPLKNNSEDFGMLGKNDMFPSMDEIKLPAGLNTIFNSLMKNLDKQFRDMDQKIGEEKQKNNLPKAMKKGGISISISTSNNKEPEIRVNSFGNMPQFKQKEEKIKKQIKKIPLTVLPKEKFSKLPKEEPSTNIRRLSDKVIYEINLPGVKSIKDVSIIKLENSIEIKAISKNKAYFKLIPINLPVTNYKISKGKLVLELGLK